ncbi:MAG TPA: ATP-binding protein, partial [bacterium]|nr:ATP-binding protein [bacterium]
MIKLSGISLSHLLPWRMAKIIRDWAQKLRALLDQNERLADANQRPDLADQLSQVVQAVVVQQSERTADYQRQKQQLESVVNALSDAVILTDAQHVLILANPAWYRLFDSSPVCLGQPLLQSVRIPELFDGLTHTQKTGLTSTIDFDYLGRFFTARISKISVSTLDGCFTVLSDVTQIKNAEQVRRDFTANVSHEMKTPLTSILGYSETLMQGALGDPPTANAFLQIIHDQAVKLKDLIDDVLHLARIESPAWKVEKQPVDLAKVVNEVVNEFRKHPKQLSLSTNEFNVTVVSDAQAIKLILHNLIDNAVKYTPTGGQVSVTVKEDPPKGVVLIVQDTGVGISTNEQSRIFERFYRVGGHSTKEGTGLGLAIVKHLVEKLGGTITVTSTVGKGSAFSLNLP